MDRRRPISARDPLRGIMHFELESDRDVTVSGIGLLEAGVPVQVDKQAEHMFVLYHGVSLVKAQFPPYVKLTAMVEEDE